MIPNETPFGDPVDPDPELTRIPEADSEYIADPEPRRLTLAETGDNP